MVRTTKLAAHLAAAALVALSQLPAGQAQQAGAGGSREADAVLLSTVEALTLRGGSATTSHRRAPAMPQLRCVSSAAVCGLHAVAAMRCANVGGGYGGREDVQWACTASLPPELRLGATDVLCEGYAGPDDPYVLRGSCGVEYRLVLTDLGEARFGDRVRADEARGAAGWWSRLWDAGAGDDRAKADADADASAWVFWALFAAVALWILYGMFWPGGDDGRDYRRRPPQRRPRNNWGAGGGWGPGWGPGGGGGGDGYDDDDPPPPYPGRKPPSSQRQGWQPGFWSGLAGGAAAGYFAGQRGNPRQPRDYGTSSCGAGPSRSSPAEGRSGSASTSSARVESTGFGGTSRR